MPKDKINPNYEVIHEERQCLIEHDGQERSGDNAPLEPRNAIYKLAVVIFQNLNIHNLGL